MPFNENWILDKIRSAHAGQRLAHAYLLTGGTPDSLENLAVEIGKTILEGDPHLHSDYHSIRPESKSRRLTVDQIRKLERELHLKSREGGLKVGAVFSADRMCLGQAEAANAFLKTLEEPPEHTIILMTTTRPSQLLPTILSRCIHLTLEEERQTDPTPEEQKWIRGWLDAGGHPVAKAYQRSQILSQWWSQLREHATQTTTSTPGFKELDDEVQKAQIESAFLLQREHSLALLIQSIWEEAPKDRVSHELTIACQALEELRSALQRGVDTALALERCHLMISQKSA